MGGAHGTNPGPWRRLQQTLATAPLELMAPNQPATAKPRHPPAKRKAESTLALPIHFSKPLQRTFNSYSMSMHQEHLAAAPPTSPPTPQDAHAPPRTSDQEEQAWLQALAHWLQQQLLQPPPAIPTGAKTGLDEAPPGDTADSPHGSAQGGGRTALPTETETAARGDGAPASHAADRLRVRLSAGRLGQLDISVIRRTGSLEVVIVVAQPRVKRLIEKQRAELEKSLKWLSLPVFCRVFVSGTTPGTGFANYSNRSTHSPPHSILTTKADPKKTSRSPQGSHRTAAGYEDENDGTSPPPLVTLIA